MQLRQLGTFGPRVSAIGLGTWAMGGAPESWGPVDDRESHAAIEQALECGINLIDTAPIYGLGHAEEIVGRAIKGRRDRVIIATKCGLQFPKDSGEPPRRSLAYHDILRECDASLRRMKINFIDLYQCHWPDPKTSIRETMDALCTLQRGDKIGAIGLSNFSCEEMTAAREFGPIVSLQAPFSMLNRRAAQDLIPFCREHDMGVLAYSPLSRGLLTGKFAITDRFSGIRARDPDFLGARYRKNLEIIEKLRPFSAKYGKTLTQLVLNWTVRTPGVTTALVGAKRHSQVAENCDVDWPLDPRDCAEITAILDSP